MINDFKNSFQNILNERISSPFSGAFIISWIAWNWRPLYYLCFNDGTNVKERIGYVTITYADWWYNFWFPLGSTIFLVFIYPWVTTGALGAWLWYKRMQRNLKKRIERQQLVSVDEWMILSQERDKLKADFAITLKEKNLELQSKEETITSFDGKLKEITEKKNQIESILDSKIQEIELKNEEVRSLNKKIDSLHNELDDVENLNFTEILNYPLTLENLKQYTFRKFPGLPVNENLQKVILNDLKLANYPSLRHIDDVFNLSKFAVLAYQIESPNMFESGTDYISKALGFVDLDFRNKHGFSKETLQAFSKYSQLIKFKPAHSLSEYEKSRVK